MHDKDVLIINNKMKLFCLLKFASFMLLCVCMKASSLYLINDVYLWKL